MLTTQYLPSIIHGTCENGNKELTMSEALINIGVFNDAEQGKRIIAALEFQAQYLPPNNAQPPQGLEFHPHRRGKSLTTIAATDSDLAYRKCRQCFRQFGPLASTTT